MVGRQIYKNSKYDSKWAASMSLNFYGGLYMSQDGRVWVAGRPQVGQKVGKSVQGHAEVYHDRYSLVAGFRVGVGVLGLEFHAH